MEDTSLICPDTFYGCITPETIFTLGHLCTTDLMNFMRMLFELSPDTRVRAMINVLCARGTSILNILTSPSGILGNVLDEIFALSEWVVAYTLVSCNPNIVEMKDLEHKEDKEEEPKREMKPWDHISVF